MAAASSPGTIGAAEVPGVACSSSNAPRCGVVGQQPHGPATRIGIQGGGLTSQMPGPGATDLEDGRRPLLACHLHDIVEGQGAGRAVNLQTPCVRELLDQ